MSGTGSNTIYRLHWSIVDNYPEHNVGSEDRSGNGGETGSHHAMYFRACHVLYQWPNQQWRFRLQQMVTMIELAALFVFVLRFFNVVGYIYDKHAE